MKQKRLFVKAGLLAVILVSATLVSWETYLRCQGRGLSYDDSGSLWSDKRKQVYEASDKATVFIGSSRIKYDLDIATWQHITGEHAVQLANVGSSPRPVLESLAEDTNFKGKLVIDATEFLFFTQAPYVNETPAKNIDYYKKETPAQKFSFVVNHALESKLYLLDKEQYSLNALLAGIKIPNRKDIYELPEFPADFTAVTFDRQNYMSDRFVKDTNLQNQVKGVWAMFGKMSAKMPPITDAAIDGIIASVKAACDKIKARGGKVVFVRPPSSGPFLAMEHMAFPREKFWNKLLAVTGCEGIHFEDYAPIANLECPEFSHLSVPQAMSFTKTVITILEDKGWKFPAHYNTIALTNSKI